MWQIVKEVYFLIKLFPASIGGRNKKTIKKLSSKKHVDNQSSLKTE